MAEAEKKETTYPVERLIAEAEAFLGVESHVAVGALHDAPRKNLTRAEAKQRLERWLKKPEEVDNAEEVAA